MWILMISWKYKHQSKLSFHSRIDATRHKESMESVFGDDIISMTIERGE